MRLASIAVLLSSSLALADVPPVPATLSSMGRLLDASNKPITGLQQLTFRVFGDLVNPGGQQVAETPLWQETYGVECDPSGVYSVLLGGPSDDNGASGKAPFPAGTFKAGQPIFIELAFGGETLAPRLVVSSVPFALVALDSGTVGGQPASAFATSAAVTGLQAAVTAHVPLHLNAGQLTVDNASASQPGALAAADWTTFNGKQNALVAADASHDGYLKSVDWNTFNNKGSGGSITPNTYINNNATTTAQASASINISGSVTANGLTLNGTDLAIDASGAGRGACANGSCRALVHDSQPGTGTLSVPAVAQLAVNYGGDFAGGTRIDGLTWENGALSVGPQQLGAANAAQGRLHISGSSGELSIGSRKATSFAAERWSIYADVPNTGIPASLRLWSNGDRFSFYTNGAISTPQFRISQPFNQSHWSGGLGTGQSNAFVSGGGTLMIIVSGSSYIAANSTVGPGLMGVQVSVDGALVGTVNRYSNELGSHKALPTGQFISPSVAGTHTLLLKPLTNTATDVNDYFSVTVMELPFGFPVCTSCQ